MPDTAQNDDEIRFLYQIISAATTVHTRLGQSQPEADYIEELAAELNQHGIFAEPHSPVLSEQEQANEGIYGLGLFVEQIVLVAITVSEQTLSDAALAQMRAALHHAGTDVGLFFNFGRRRLEHQRIRLD